MQTISAELANYEQVSNAQSDMSDTLSTKAVVLTKAIQDMFARQQMMVVSTVDHVQIQMGIVAAVGIALGILLERIRL